MITKILTNWFYRTDLILDEGSLDDFHDKSVVRQEAKKLARAIGIWLIISFVLGALIF